MVFNYLPLEVTPKKATRLGCSKDRFPKLPLEVAGKSPQPKMSVGVVLDRS